MGEKNIVPVEPSTKEKIYNLADRVFNIDSWKNLVTGLGGSKDKRTQISASWRPMPYHEAECIFACDDVAEKVCALPARMGLKEWVEHKIPDDDKKELQGKIRDEEERLGLKEKVQEAWTMGRIHGGAGLFLAVDDGKELHEPLVMEDVKNFRAVNVLDREDITVMSLNGDIESPFYNKPEFYHVTRRTNYGSFQSFEMDLEKTKNTKRSSMRGSVAVVHRSRVLMFHGSFLPKTLFDLNDYFHDSVLNRMKQILADFNMAHGSVAATMQDFRQGILKLRNLYDIVTEGDNDVLKERVQLMNLTRSVLNTMVLDAEAEDYEQKVYPLTGVADVLEKINQRLTGVTGLPHTVIFGNGSSGSLGDKGESEDRTLKDAVHSLRVSDCQPQLDTLFKLMLSAKLGPTGGEIPKDWTWDWIPLWTQSEEMMIKNRKAQSEIDKTYYEIGALSSKEITDSRFGGDEYSHETQIDKEVREAFEDEPEPEPTRAKRNGSDPQE